MGVELLSDGQAAAFGRFCGVPTWEQLEWYFVLDDADRALVGRRWVTRTGWASVCS